MANFFRSQGIFQFTPLREGLPDTYIGLFPISHFNSRPCERGFSPAFGRVEEEEISIHAPARGASFTSVFFRLAVAISIHAPARGASYFEIKTPRGTVLFQFTPLREGLPVDMILVCLCFNFNSRPCERGFSFDRYTNTPVHISIHAPARGASQIWDLILAYSSYFNSRPCERGFRSAHSNRSAIAVFQFTPLREGLLHALVGISHAFYFNSRPCERGFVYQFSPYDFLFNFNSRPCERGFRFIRNIFTRYRFQFTPLREGLRVRRRKPAFRSHFNSRPCERGFSKKHQFFYPSFAVFYSLITFSQNQFFQFPSLISIDLIFVQFSLRRSPKFLCMGNICARFYNNKGSPASTFNFFPIESILF